MEDFIEHATPMIVVNVPQRIDWQTEDDTGLATLSPIGSPYSEGETPLFI